MIEHFDRNACDIATSCGKLFVALALAWPLCPECRAAGVLAQVGAAAPAGIAWNVQGDWKIDRRDAAIRTGDPVPPGSLLRPDTSDSNHSITVLLPDGQSVLNECFTAKDCARGFRVPELERNPDPFVVRFLGRIRAVLAQQRNSAQAALSAPSPEARDESAVELGPDNRIEISGLAASLSDGQYVYDLSPIRSAFPPQTGISLQKSGRSIALQVPGPGLYTVKIFDRLKNPRIDYLIAAVEPGKGNEVVADFQKEHAFFKDCKEDFQGWPAHDFQRDYLEALMLDIHPASNDAQNPQPMSSPESGVTAEPVFSPTPGMTKGNLAITVRSATPGAAIHYSIDGSQPFASSPVYRAPIVMKRVPIRIKAFAESPGRKDSPVVTGFFGVENP